MTYEDAIRMQQLEKKIDGIEANLQAVKANKEEIELIENRIFIVLHESSRHFTDLLETENTGALCPK